MTSNDFRVNLKKGGITKSEYNGKIFQSLLHILVVGQGENIFSNLGTSHGQRYYFRNKNLNQKSDIFIRCVQMVFSILNQKDFHPG